MKIQILSDLHIEFGDFKVPGTDADVVVFAGDINVGTDGLEWIQAQNINKPLIYVLGNHEYYRHDFTLIEEIRRLAGPDTHILDCDAIELAGVRFLGCTLWTDFSLFGEEEKPVSMQITETGMADFKLISLNDKRFTPEDSIQLHQQQRDWLQSQLASTFDGKTVVVTHHFPSPKSIHPKYAKDMLTPAFGSDLEAMMDRDKVRLWIHGHTHEAFDYEVKGTRVVCNPRGYQGYEKGEFFRSDLLIEI
ncbi:MAG: metallophosphoesterase [Gammaproteobacteria bacterium]|nr:metallophosphoesterase [Gammaproteobacteria bacterium]